jgi:hypothetical protein
MFDLIRNNEPRGPQELLRCMEGAVMTRWQYAMISNPQSGTDAVTFSQAQGADFVREAAEALGKGVKANDSNEVFLHLNLNQTRTVWVSGFLGARGWELVGYSTLTGGHEYWVFKKEVEAATQQSV